MDHTADALWQAFAKTGDVRDYLRYRAVAVTDKEASYARIDTDPHHRGADYSGKQ